MAVCFRHVIGQFAICSLLCGPKSQTKRFKQSFKMSVNHEDLDVDFVLQHFNLRYINEGDEETESYRKSGF